MIRLFGIIASVLVLATAFVLIDKILFISQAETTVGEVIDFVKSDQPPTHPEQKNLYPLVKYNHHHETKTFRARLPLNRDPRQIGDKVQVLYTGDSQSPRAQINDFRNQWAQIAILSALSFVFSFFSLSMKKTQNEATRIEKFLRESGIQYRGIVKTQKLDDLVKHLMNMDQRNPKIHFSSEPYDSELVFAVTDNVDGLSKVYSLSERERKLGFTEGRLGTVYVSDKNPFVFLIELD